MFRFDPYSPGARAIGIGLRTSHLGAMAVLVGGLAFAAPAAQLGAWQGLTAASGLLLLLLERSHSPHWLYQGRGLIALLHVALAGLAAGSSSRSLAAAALVVGAVGSHLPRTVRRWSLRHRRVVE